LPTEHASAASVELLRAAELLYAIGERDLVLSFLTGLAEQSDDAAGLASLAELAARNDDARAVLLVGKTALARGLPLDVHAFPDIGVPPCSPIGPALARSIVYSVARTESEFNQRVVSPAKAVGLMQVINARACRMRDPASVEPAIPIGPVPSPTGRPSGGACLGARMNLDCTRWMIRRRRGPCRIH
jgi:soluble lytic murein transglycosylase-like protein